MKLGSMQSVSCVRSESFREQLKGVVVAAASLDGLLECCSEVVDVYEFRELLDHVKRLRLASRALCDRAEKLTMDRCDELLE